MNELEQLVEEALAAIQSVEFDISPPHVENPDLSKAKQKLEELRTKVKDL